MLTIISVDDVHAVDDGPFLMLDGGWVQLQTCILVRDRTFFVPFDCVPKQDWNCATTGATRMSTIAVVVVVVGGVEGRWMRTVRGSKLID